MSFDRVRETSTTTGPGALTLAGAPAGFRRFNTVYAPGGGVPVYYVVEGVTVDGLQTGQWEIGVGALAGDGTLTRGNIVASSNAGALVVFAAGTKRIFDAATVGAVDARIAALSSQIAAMPNTGGYGFPSLVVPGGGATLTAGADDILWLVPMRALFACTLTTVCMRATTGVAGTAKPCIYASSVSNPLVVTDLIEDFGSLSLAGTATQTIAISRALEENHVYWVGAWFQLAASAVSTFNPVSIAAPLWRGDNLNLGITRWNLSAAGGGPPASIGAALATVPGNTNAMFSPIGFRWTTP